MFKVCQEENAAWSLLDRQKRKRLKKEEQEHKDTNQNKGVTTSSANYKK